MASAVLHRGVGPLSRVVVARCAAQERWRGGARPVGMAPSDPETVSSRDRAPSRGGAPAHARAWSAQRGASPVASGERNRQRPHILRGATVQDPRLSALQPHTRSPSLGGDSDGPRAPYRAPHRRSDGGTNPTGAPWALWACRSTTHEPCALAVVTVSSALVAVGLGARMVLGDVPGGTPTGGASSRSTRTSTPARWSRPDTDLPREGDPNSPLDGGQVRGRSGRGGPPQRHLVHRGGVLVVTDVRPSL